MAGRKSKRYAVAAPVTPRFPGSTKQDTVHGWYNPGDEMAQFHFYGPHEDGSSVMAHCLWKASLGPEGGLPDFEGTMVLLPGMRSVRRLRYLWLQMALDEGRNALLLPKMLGLHEFLTKLPLDRVGYAISPVERVLRLAENLTDTPLRRLLPGAGEVSALGLASHLIRGLDDLIRYAPSLESLLQLAGDPESLDLTLPASVRQMVADSVAQALEVQIRYLTGLREEGLTDPVLAGETDARGAASWDGWDDWMQSYATVWVGLFQDATLGELELLAALARLPNVHLLLPQVDASLVAYLSNEKRASETVAQRSPAFPAWRLAHAVGALGQPGLCCPPSYWMAANPVPGAAAEVARVVASLPEGALDADRFRSPHVVECEDPFHEAMTMAWWAAERVEEGDSALLVVPSPEQGRLLESLLSTWDIECESTFGQPLAHAPAFGLLRQLDELVALGYPYQAVCGVFSHPLCRLSLRTPLREAAWQLEREVVPSQKVSMGLERLAQASRDREEALRTASSDAGAIRADYSVLRSALLKLGSATRALADARANPASVPTLAQVAQQVLDEVMGTTLPVSLLSQADLQFLEHLQAFLEASQGLSIQVQWQEFLDLLLASIGGERVHEPRNREVAVVITDWRQARLTDRSHVWFGGLNDADLPGSEPTNPVLPNDARQALGLMGASYSEALSAMDFTQAWLRTGEPNFSYVRQKSGTPVLRSRFLERIAGVAALRGIPDSQWLDVRTYRTLLPVRCETDFESLALLDHAQPVVAADPLATMEFWATDLEAYLRCPYQFFCKRELGLRPPEEIQEVLSAQDLGNLVHDAMRAFYDQNRSRIEHLPGPWQGAIEHSNAHEAAALLRLLLEQLFEQQGKADVQSRELSGAVLDSVPDIIEAERLRWSEGFVPWRFETVTTYRPEPTLPVVFKARFDRVDTVGCDHSRIAVLDYKTGNPPATGELKEGLRPQLFVAALGLVQNLGPGAVVEQVHYYRLKVGSSSALGTPAHRDAKGGLGRATHTMLSCLDGYRTLLAKIAEDLAESRGARFPATPGTWCTWCSFSSVCRKAEVVR